MSLVFSKSLKTPQWCLHFLAGGLCGCLCNLQGVPTICFVSGVIILAMDVYLPLQKLVGHLFGNTSNKHAALCTQAVTGQTRGVAHMPLQTDALTARHASPLMALGVTTCVWTDPVLKCRVYLHGLPCIHVFKGLLLM